MPSFDVVSRLNFQEIDNAISNCLREIGNRYDFKGSNTAIDRNEKKLIIVTDNELQLKQIQDLIIIHMVRRKIDSLCLSKGLKEKASRNQIRQTYNLIEGIDQTIAKNIILDIKKSKLKIQIKINGSELRVDGKKKDDLQTVMQMIKEAKIGIPVQFVNFRD